jgi:hypothetical protein
MIIPKDYVPYTPSKITIQSRQTKLESALEISVSISSGFAISYLVWIFIVPILWPEQASSHATAFGITTLFTVTSVARSYIWRRFFNAELHKAIHNLIKHLYD